VPNPGDAFWLPRKRERKLNCRGAFVRKLRHIELIGEKQVQCIAVTDPSGLYLTDDHIVTHNTKSGKTVSCIFWLAEQAMRGREGQNFWWIAPVYTQAEIAFRRMKFGLHREGNTQIYQSGGFRGANTITMANGTRIWFKSGENPDSLYGEDVYAAVIDEASRVKEEAWHAIRSTLTATRGPIRIIGNVKGRKNWFYQLARRAEAGEPNMEYHRLIAHDAIEAHVLERDEIEDAKRSLPENVFRELYLAEASDDGGNPFGIAHIQACIKPALSQYEPVAWGWDLGKALDWTVGIGLDRYGDVAAFERFQKPWPETVSTIIRITNGRPALVDSTGLGDPIVDYLQRDFGSNFEGFRFGSGSKQQLMEGLAVGIQQREIGYPDGVLVVELESFEYEYSRTGVSYAAAEGMHDDCVCALALAFACSKQNRGIEVWEALGRQAMSGR
jgi:hypothetical protein